MRGRLSAICEHLSPAGRGSVQGAQVKVIQPVAGRLADGAQAVFLKGAFQPGIFQQFGENFGAALARVGHVVVPGVLTVLLDHGPEFQRHGLREAVVDIVEGAGIDVVLLLPALAVAVERDVAVQAQPGHVDAEQALPLGMALRGGQVGLFVGDMLEVVHRRAVGDEGQRPGQVAVAELGRVGAEEAFGPGPGEELHRHRVALAGFHRGPGVLHRHAVAVHPGGKGVARLVGDDLDVALGAIEVGKDEGHVVIGEGGAVAAARLAGGGQHVEQLAVHHGAEEGAGLGGEFVVEFLPHGQNVIGAAHRARVAGAEHQRLVGIAQRVGNAQPLGLGAADAVGQRHQVLDDGGAELFNVRLGVAVALHAVVAQRGVALVPELFAHAVPQVDEFVVDRIHAGLVLLEPGSLGLPGGQAAGVVGVGLEGFELAQRVDAALKRNLGAGQQLLVFLGELVFPLHIGDDRGRERLAGDFGIGEHQFAVLGRKFGAEGAGQQRGRKGVAAGLQFGVGGVPELLLGVVELVPRVDAVADAGQLRLGGDVAFQRVVVQKSGAGGFIVGRVAQPGRDGVVLGLHRGQVGAMVGHFGKGHGDAPFRLKFGRPVRPTLLIIAQLPARCDCPAQN